MARYYDMDALAEMIRARADILIEGRQALHYIANWLDKLPPADVVPKSEVEKIFEAVDEMANLLCHMTGLNFTFWGKYAELKKKYTEGKE